MLKQPKPGYGPSLFSLICSLLLKDLSFIFILYLGQSNSIFGHFIAMIFFFILHLKNLTLMNFCFVFEFASLSSSIFQISSFLSLACLLSYEFPSEYDMIDVSVLNVIQMILSVSVSVLQLYQCQGQYYN